MLNYLKENIIYPLSKKIGFVSWIYKQMKEFNVICSPDTVLLWTPISAIKKGTRGVLGPPRRSQICHQKVPNLTSEGPKLYLRSNNGFKKEENAWLCLHNASLEGPELFGPPKILAQLRLWRHLIIKGQLYWYYKLHNALRSTYFFQRNNYNFFDFHNPDISAVYDW